MEDNRNERTVIIAKTVKGIIPGAMLVILDPTKTLIAAEDCFRAAKKMLVIDSVLVAIIIAIMLFNTFGLTMGHGVIPLSFLYIAAAIILVGRLVKAAREVKRCEESLKSLRKYLQE